MWVEKFRPKRLDEIVGQETAALKLRHYVLTYRKQPKKAVALHGPVGSGKTSLVYAVANNLEYEVVELNASEFRDSEAIRTKLGPALLQASLFAKGRIVLIGDIEVMGRQDRGGLPAILSLLAESKFPVIFTTNDIWDRKLAGMRQKCMLIEAKKLSNADVVKILSKVIGKVGVGSGVDVESKAELFQKIAMISRGDARAAVNDLEVSIGLDVKDLDDLNLGDRDKDENIFNAIRTVFKSPVKVALGAFNNVNLELDQCLLWLDENLPLE